MKKLEIKRILYIFLLFTASPLLFSQNVGSAVIVYAEGEGFSLVRGGETNFFEIEYDNVLGMLLYAGDIILTEEDTFLEMQVTSNASLIKIAENTTFEFQSIGIYGGGSLKVAYGRIRAKINKLTNNDEFEIAGTDTVAGVRGTDFGYDLTFGQDITESESNEAITTVYCFDGSVKVQQENLETKEIKEILIGADQMVVTSSDKPEVPLVIYEIEDEIDQFWEENKFVYEMAVKPVLVVADDYKKEDYSEKIFGKKRRLEYTGGGLLISGLIAGIGGIATYSFMEDKSLGIGLMTFGGASLIAGVIFLIQSGTLPDPPEGWIPPE